MITRVFFFACALTMAFVAPSSAVSTVTVTNVWSRPATGTGAVYATIRNSAATSDALVSASSSVAKTVELHESTPVSSGSMSKSMNGGMQGMPAMAMHPVKSIAVAAGASTMLKPGGYHIMLIGLRHDLKAGESFPLTLHFRTAGDIHTVVHVRSMTQ